MANRYSLEGTPAGRNDGSGYVDHQVKAQTDDSGDWFDIPGYHKTFVVPADEIDTVMAMPDSTGTERQAKNQAYKTLLINHANDFPVALLGPTPPSTTDWTNAGLEQYKLDYATWEAAYQDWLDEEFTPINTAADQAAADINEYITVTLGQVYPVPFNLDVEI